ncbi:MAG: hypothetical protein ACLFUH_06605 [Bacteroidales bacterium]
MGKICEVPENSNYNLKGDEPNESSESIGNISDIYYYNEDTYKVESFIVSNITTNQIRNVLGESSNSIAELCSSDKVNKNALFRPDGNSPYKMGDFAGYHHDAKAPLHFYLDDFDGSDLKLNTYDTDSFEVGTNFRIARGERPPDIDNAECSIDRLRLEIKLVIEGTEIIKTKDLEYDNDNGEGIMSISVNLYDEGFDNDYYDDVQLETMLYYINTFGDIEKEIDNLHLSTTTDIEPNFTDVDVMDNDFTTVPSYDIKHYFFKGYDEIYEIYDEDFEMKINKGLNDYSKNYEGYLIHDDTSTFEFETEYYEGGGTDPMDKWQYYFSIVKFNSEYYKGELNFVEEGYTWKDGVKHYKVVSDKLNQFIREDEFEEIDGFYTVTNDGKLEDVNGNPVN